MNIVFITNGDSTIGYGHVSRTLMLYTFLKKQNHDLKIIVPQSCTFSVNEDFKKVKSFSRGDLDFIEKDYEIVIIDSVELDYDLLSWLRDSNLFVVTITLFLFDLAKRYENISFFPSIGGSEIIKAGETEIFIGNKYLTLRDEFAKTNFTVRPNANKILITMGGTDPYSLCIKALNSLKNDTSLTITVLLSEKAKDYQELKEISKFNDNINLLGFTEDIVKLYSSHDIALINGGLTRYEACVVGIPFLALSIHQKQFGITQELVDLGAGINLGVYDEISNEDIYLSVKKLLADVELRKKTSLKMRKLIDTDGVKRICNIICDKFLEYEADYKMG